MLIYNMKRMQRRMFLSFGLHSALFSMFLEKNICKYHSMSSEGRNSIALLRLPEGHSENERKTASRTAVTFSCSSPFRRKKLLWSLSLKLMLVGRTDGSMQPVHLCPTKIKERFALRRSQSPPSEAESDKSLHGRLWCSCNLTF